MLNPIKRIKFNRFKKDLHSRVSYSGISPQETGPLIGYTKDPKNPSQKPTLYFKNGRFTQEHELADNVGWHPNMDKHVARNVSEDTLDEIYDDYEKNSRRFTNVRKKFRKRRDSYGDKLTYAEASVLNHPKTGEKVNVFHQSRSKLLRPSDKEFDKNIYRSIWGVVHMNGKLARNER